MPMSGCLGSDITGWVPADAIGRGRVQHRGDPSSASRSTSSVCSAVMTAVTSVTTCRTDQTFVPLRAQRTQIERYVHRKSGFKPSTMSPRMAVVTGFYRTYVIDAVLEHLPADYVHRLPRADGVTHPRVGALAERRPTRGGCRRIG